MTNQISFINKLRHIVGEILEENNFKISSVYTEPAEVLVYERFINSLPNPDRVTFHGSEKVKNRIYATAVSRNGGLAFLVTLRELETNFDSADPTQDDWWSYNDEKQLDSELDSIAILVKNQLLQWFENPFVKLSATETLSNQESFINDLRRAAELHEQIANHMRAKGKLDEAEKHERTAKAYKRHSPS